MRRRSEAVCQIRIQETRIGRNEPIRCRLDASRCSRPHAIDPPSPYLVMDYLVGS